MAAQVVVGGMRAFAVGAMFWLILAERYSPQGAAEEVLPGNGYERAKALAPLIVCLALALLAMIALFGRDRSV